MFGTIFSDLDFIKEISAWVSITGLVFEFKTISVKPLLPATFPPLMMVSLSSKPGSPNETLLSSHPNETWRSFILNFPYSIRWD